MKVKDYGLGCVTTDGAAIVDAAHIEPFAESQNDDIINGLALWDGVWKVIAMWKSGRNNQLAWFICIAIFNTVCILPIVYLVWGQKDRNLKTSAVA